MASDEFQIQIKIDMAMEPSRTLKLVVKSNFWIQRVKKMIEDKKGIPQAESILYKQGVRLELDSTYTLDDYKTMPDDMFYVVPRIRGGMPKRGVKKITKAEKVHLLRARATFASANLTQQPMQIVQAITNDPHFVTNAVNNLAQQQNGLAQLRELKNKMDTVARWDQLVDQLPQYLIPQVAQMKQQRDDINKALEAFDAAVEAVFADQFYENNGYNTDGLYTQIEGHITALERAEIAAQAVAAAQGNNNDAAMGN